MPFKALSLLQQQEETEMTLTVGHLENIDKTKEENKNHSYFFASSVF